MLEIPTNPCKEEEENGDAANSISSYCDAVVVLCLHWGKEERPDRHREQLTGPVVDRGHTEPGAWREQWAHYTCQQSTNMYMYHNTAILIFFKLPSVNVPMGGLVINSKTLNLSSTVSYFKRVVASDCSMCSTYNMGVKFNSRFHDRNTISLLKDIATVSQALSS